MNSNNIQILLVDDKPHNLRFLSEILTENGYKVQRAISGQLALNAALDSSPDLIILDILMPNMNGYEVCQKLKSFEKTREIPVIFISVLEQVIDKVKAFKVGGVDYITKPFHVEEVLARIENQLTIRNLQKQLQKSNKELKDKTLRLQSEIQERKRTKEALFLAEKRYNNLAINSVEGIYQSNQSGRYLSANLALASLYGYNSLQEFFSKIKNISQLYVQPNRWQELMAALGIQELLPGCESLVYKKNGQTLWISESLRAIRDATGKMLYYEGTVTDITLQKLSQEALAFQKERTDQLLQSLLPARIARRLQQEEGTIAESFDDVSIIFADIVGFTAFSATKTAKEQVKVLDTIFSTFDEFAEQQGLEKIKTIGDAYMVVGGLPTPYCDRAAELVKSPSLERIARMALDMQAAMTTLGDRIGHTFRLRIGIHIGPVVAGAIGRSKFVYDLWGDTVNIASWMESSGIPGEIQVSAQTYHRLKEKFLFEERGYIPIKGNREVMTYLLRGDNSAISHQ